MEKTITLQKEFEALIEELERLKSINEITIENSTSAKNTIDEMKSFSQAINKFKNTVISDYEENKKTLQKLEKDLKESIEAINKETNRSISTYKSKQESFNERLDQVIIELVKEIKGEVQTFQNEIAETKKQIQSEINSFQTKTYNKLTNNFTEFDKELKKIKTQFKSNQDLLIKEIAVLNKEIQNNQKQNKKQLLIASVIIILLLIIIMIRI